MFQFKASLPWRHLRYVCWQQRSYNDFCCPCKSSEEEGVETILTWEKIGRKRFMEETKGERQKFRNERQSYLNTERTATRKIGGYIRIINRYCNSEQSSWFLRRGAFSLDQKISSWPSIDLLVFVLENILCPSPQICNLR